MMAAVGLASRSAFSRQARVLNAIQHTIAVPPDEVAVDRAVRRKSPSEGSAIGDRCSKYTALMTTRMSVRRLPPPGLGGGINGATKRPLVIREVARVPQVNTIVFRSVLKRPHRRPLSRMRSPPLESRGLFEVASSASAPREAEPSDRGRRHAASSGGLHAC
jgi:hypothetical protein